MGRNKPTRMSLAAPSQVFAVVFSKLPSRDASLGERLAFLISRCSILGRNTKPLFLQRPRLKRSLSRLLYAGRTY